MENWTIQKLLNWIKQYLTEKGIESARLSAELLLSHVLQMQRIELYTQYNKIVSKEQLNALHELVKRAGNQEPIAYLVGKTEFYSLELVVNNNCMIPRPETELLAQRAIEFLRSRKSQQNVLDLCSGCGCIAVAIAKNFAEANIIATDICDKALSVANQNIEKYNLQDRITLLQGDLFDPLVPGLDNPKFDLIVSNPPYVSDAEYQVLEPNVKEYEPKLALYAGVQGLDIYKKIAEEVVNFLNPSAVVILEIGYAQGQAIKVMLENTGLFAQINIEKDLHNNDRIIIADTKTTINTNDNILINPGVIQEN
jgi:release factor glutamine methyltransferase